MKEIFLSASIPSPKSKNYFSTANPFLIQCAVRELLISFLGKYRVVWGGHPAITPMIWSICEDLNIDYEDSVILYQSKYFSKDFPEENREFSNIVLVDEIANDREESLNLMRNEMLSRKGLVAAVFIGGMEGIFEEHKIFKSLHKEAKTLSIPAPGGAALEVAKEEVSSDEEFLNDIDFSTIFHEFLKELAEKGNNSGLAFEGA